MSLKVDNVSLGLEDSFLSHSTSAGGADFLKNWKPDGQVVVWLHPQADVLSVWNHPWFVVDVDRDEEDDEENPLAEIRQRSFRCFEREGILKKQKFRNKKTGERAHPPETCPFDLFLEWVYAQVKSGKLDITDDILRFRAGEDDDDTEDVVLQAGGVTGMFSKIFQGDDKRLQKEITKKTGVRGDGDSAAYKQVLFARQSYIFRVVPHDDPESGCVIDQEGVALGNALKAALHKRLEEHGEAGSFKNAPFAVKYKFDDNKSFSDKYDAVVLSREEMPEHVKRAFLEPPPDVDRVTKTYNLYKFRQELEAALLIDAPIAEFFASVEEAYGIDTTSDYEAGEEEGDDDDEEERPARSTAKSGKGAAPKQAPKPTGKPRKEEKKEEPEDEPELVDNECLACGKDMGDEEEVCPHCSAVHGVVEENGDEIVVIVQRPCGNPDCGNHEVEVRADGTGKCLNCGAVHDDQWKYVLPEPEEKKAKSARRRGSVSENARARARRTAGK